jgi:hypothetical protein
MARRLERSAGRTTTKAARPCNDDAHLPLRHPYREDVYACSRYL